MNREQKTTSSERREDREGSHKILESLLRSRTVLLSADVNPKTAQRVMEQLLVLENDNPEEPITLLLNSPGGDVHSGFAVYDLIRFIRPRVKVVCAGLCASIATVILLAAEKGDRHSLPHARFLLHQPLFQSEVFGPASDLEITAREIIETRERINKLLARETGQPLEKIERDTERDFWMSAEEARQYGLIHKLVTNRADLDWSA